MKPDLKKEFGQRLVRLHPGVLGLRSLLEIEAKALEGEAAILQITASDATLDRYDEVIDPNGWDLKDYQRNPVIVNSHQYDDIAFCMGRAQKTEVKDGRLRQEILFAVDINPMAKMCYQLYRAKFLNAFSVGFVPVEWVNGNGTGYARKYTKQQLLENSAVIVPANPSALQDALDEGAITKSDLSEVKEHLRELGERLQKISANEGKKPESEARAAGPVFDSAQLKQLSQQARTVAELVRRTA
jgi:uncharacterized protein